MYTVLACPGAAFSLLMALLLLRVLSSGGMRKLWRIPDSGLKGDVTMRFRTTNVSGALESVRTSAREYLCQS